MNKVICDVCGTDYPETALQCPICGCARADGGQTSAGNTVPGEEEKPAYTYVKGGRFSKSNVRKRLKANQIQESFVPEIEYDDDEDDDEAEGEEEIRSNWGLITIVILLLLAIIAVSSYIAIVHFGLGGDKDPDPTGTTGSVQSSTGSTEDTSGLIQIPCTGLTLIDSEITLSTVDSAWLMTFSVEPTDTTDALTFTSSDESVAVVDENGRVTAVGAGEATVTVTCGDFVAECKILCDFTADPTDPTDPSDPTDPTEPDDTVILELNRSDFTLSSKGASWKVYSGELDPADITWSSDNEEVVTVENGKVVAVGPGRTRIHAEYEGQKASCWVSCSFPAEEPTEPTEPDNGEESTEPTEPAELYSLMVNGDVSPYGDENNASVTLYVGDSFTLTVENSMGARMEVEWTMSADGICSVDGRKVTGAGAGKVTLTTTYEGQTFTCEVIVKEEAATA